MIETKPWLICLIALLILVVSLYTVKAIDFSIFPSILLTTTLFRLSLNVASTRLILLQGDAGRIVQTFGDFVAGGSFVVGLVIFLILFVIQFITLLFRMHGARRVR